MKNKILLESTGWLGAIVLLSAYFMNSIGLIQGMSLPYQLMNLGGSLLVAFYTYVKKAYPNTVLNIIWMVIAGFAIMNILLKK
ncbi:MAG: hypothetical protein C5B52_14820 [Bacteroidetes bacterium]|nr:MAG: hypothetical protein C5B52_14820 [Bacteroidota bacterium]